MIPFTFRAILAFSIAMIGIMYYKMYENVQDRSAFSNTTGIVIRLEQHYGKLPMRNEGKFRYLQVKGYPYVFEIFIGKDPGDFTPTFEQIDSLRVGDLITIYYDEKDATHEERINRFASFIDKGTKNYYEKGDSTRIMALAMIGYVLCLE